MVKSIRATQLDILKTVLMGRRASVAHGDDENGVLNFRVFPLTNQHLNKPFTFTVSDNGCSVTCELYGRPTTLTGLSNVVAIIKSKTEGGK